jgi:hypothetical protein
MNNLFGKIIDTFIILVLTVSSIVCFILQFNIKTNEPLLMDDEFLPFFENFKKDADKYKVVPDFKNMSTTFTNELPEGVLAYCLPKFNTIKVSRAKWNRLDPLSRKLLLYHEWGHCALRREHVEYTYNYSIITCPDSIMYPYIDPTVRCYDLSPQWYDKELFTNLNNRETIP